jgi:hypothetical protein
MISTSLAFLERLQSFSTGEITAVIIVTLAGILLTRLAWQRWHDARRRQPNSAFSPTTLPDDSRSAPQTQPMQHLMQMMEVRKEMNPLTEAEVYLAFGRDKDAEALMLDAIRKSPMKLGYRIKLAEIYAQRRDTVSFQITAAKLKLMTDASGPVWSHICDMGRRIDPRNPDYRSVGGTTAESADFVARHLDGGLPAFEDTQPVSLPPWMAQEPAAPASRPPIH